MNADVDSLTQLLLTGTQPEAAAFVQTLQGAGISSEQLFLNLLTPAARRLGVMWEEDHCDFTDVTVGVLRLANVMRLVSNAFEAETVPVQAGPRALLIQAPGEQHGLGIAMVASFFRRAGWNVQADPLPDSRALVARVQQEWFSLVGISVACTNRAHGLAADISAIRAASRNPDIAIMVGGSIFIAQPHLAARIGADCTAADASLAVATANALVSRRACQT
jgi:methanogenic corrinoid protein MtbC1